MKDDTLQRNNIGSTSGTGSPYYLKKLAFSALIKNTYFKNEKT